MDWWVGEWIGVGGKGLQDISIYIEEYKVWDDFGVVKDICRRV
jgi:hypothetical protein